MHRRPSHAILMHRREFSTSRRRCVASQCVAGPRHINLPAIVKQPKASKANTSHPLPSNLNILYALELSVQHSERGNNNIKAYYSIGTIINIFPKYIKKLNNCI